MCTSCHNPHAANLQKLLSADAPELCFGCHDKTAFTKSVVHRPVAAGKCTACHNPHAADTAPLLPEAKADFCTRCHPDKNSGKHILAGHGLGDHPMHGKADPSRPGKELSCASCHSNPHVSGKKFLFTDETKSPGSLCLLCHTKVTVKP
jgi:predicted CXXCH cytochrome family protein